MIHPLNRRRFTLGVLVVVAGLSYMMVVPGWQPAAIAGRRSGRLWSLVKFVLVARAIAAAATGFVVFTEEKDWPPGRAPADSVPPPP